MRFTSTIQPSGYIDSFKKVEAVLARVQAIRDAAGMDMEFGIDFHGRVHKSMAKVLAKELETYHPMFIEEPVLSENIEALREVARYTSTPIATGERMFSRWDFKRVLTDGYVDIIQPDQSHAGGISECKKIAAMYMNAEVFLNGDSLFVHPYGYTPFWLEITELLNRGSDNLLRIVAQSRQPGTRWYSGGGLYREVSLVVGPEQCMLPWEVYARCTACDATQADVCVDFNVRGAQEGAAQIELFSPDGRLAARAEAPIRAENRVVLRIRRPQLWSVDNPALYSLRIVLPGGDEHVQKVGLRSIHIDARSGFTLNGSAMKLCSGAV